ncbi:hypothetical protein JAK58_09355 [Stenotrophomonas maltophilia]|jgi:hypothetical protein|uniref:hypothetical protein n=1 Tax=Stenotrophomonas maltophilia TaxID=40324 RepID=UPI0012B338B7|nr:hypothetical protein [Stenotrophomonas maltophilia]MBN4939923.1 hypothetical protein [Stenotrophomonas maltophilia]MCU1091715.1 hypothetical protein [Stenotrophomonas maltophilia]MDZ5841034.1 hypothetical protein [Stenotrophomonas maltophilia]HDS1559781.1 hypothetical protein [Stenotrophomonas maltophilia]HEL4259711.1 hypothetical protein [Stenotrophomonas maltophilia]
MSMVDAFSQCWWLGNSCVPDWEAWAVAAGGAAVVTTAVLGVVTYRLGKAANSASAAAVRIAGFQADKQAYREESERLLVLVQVIAEVSSNAGMLDHLLGLLSQENSKAVFVTDTAFQNRIFGRLNKLSFPSLERVRDRLHYLDRKTAACYVRAVGMFELLQSGDKHRDGTETQDELRNGFRALRATIPWIIEDLRVVEAEGVAAVNRLGLNKDPTTLQAANLDG